MQENLLTKENQTTSLETGITSMPSENNDNIEGKTPIEVERKLSGQANAPHNDLILGKFKSVEDLTKAYQELQKLQGSQSAELGNLRENLGFLNLIKDAWEKENSIKNDSEFLKSAVEKYNAPEYFQDPTFKHIFKEAYSILGNKLDVDKFVNLLEGYVSSRIFNHDRLKSSNSENEMVVSSLIHSKNPNPNIEIPQKRVDEMTEAELKAFLNKVI